MSSLIEFNGVRFPVGALRLALTDAAHAVMFSKFYKLDQSDLGRLFRTVLRTDAVEALAGQPWLHSEELQSYLVEIGYEFLVGEGEMIVDEGIADAMLVLPAVWEGLAIEVAKSIAEVAEKLKHVMGRMPANEGAMILKSMMVMNAKRPTIGAHQARIERKHEPPNLVVFDVSGSMSEETVETIVDEVVSLSWTANAALAIVSNHCTYWARGEASREAVLKAAEYGGTHYEELAPLFDDDWGTVITVADYDSSWAAMEVLKKCKGSIGLLLDVSLVPRRTFLSECLAPLASESRQLLESSHDLT